MVTQGIVIKEKQKSEESTVARLRREGEIFEILVDCKEAMKVREGSGNIEEALMVREVFKDARKGEKHGELIKYFGTDDVASIASKIISEGEIQLTQSYRNELIEQKKKQVINEIVSKAIDPKTKTPIPPKRIELSMEQAGVKIDYLRSVEDQVKEVIEKLKAIIPISIEELMIKITVSPQYTGKIYGILKKYSQVLSQNYLSNGSSEITVKVAGGLKNKLVSEIKSVTHGNIIIKEE